MQRVRTGPRSVTVTGLTQNARSEKKIHYLVDRTIKNSYRQDVYQLGDQIYDSTR